MSITELAKLRQVTSETLRYYDRIGLITPDYVDPQTRYRYYSIRQYEKLGTIKELRQLGMSIHGGSREHAFAFTRLERYLDEVAPILASDRIGVYADWHLLEPSDDYIPAVPMIFVERDAIESEHKRTIPPGDYLCMNYRRGELERYHPSFARLHTYMAEHGWVLNGMIFQFYKIDVTLTSDPDETLMEIQVPVRPAES